MNDNEANAKEKRIPDANINTEHNYSANTDYELRTLALLANDKSEWSKICTEVVERAVANPKLEWLVRDVAHTNQNKEEMRQVMNQYSVEKEKQRVDLIYKQKDIEASSLREEKGTIMNQVDSVKEKIDEAGVAGGKDGRGGYHL